MARIYFPNYLALLTADAPQGDVAVSISAEDSDILINGMDSGDYTYMILTGALYTEVVMIAKVGSLLELTREQCEAEGRDFKTGDCLTDYTGECGETIEDDCTPTIVSSDNSITVSGACDTQYDLGINPDALPSDALGELCDASIGSILAGDRFIAITKAGNGSCIFKQITMDELCARLATCNTGGGSGEECVCDVSFAIDGTGNLVVTYADMTTDSLGQVVGQNGNDGADGADGVDGADGADGAAGLAGADGDDGRGIVDANIDSNGDLILTYTSSPLTQNLGTVVGADGADGEDAAVALPNVGRYTGSPSTGGTSYISGMTVVYGFPNSGDSLFTFDTPMPDSNFLLSITNLDGTASTAPASGRSATGFSILGPVPAGVLTILAYE